MIHSQYDKVDSDDDFEFQFGDEEQLKESDSRQKRKRFDSNEEMGDTFIIVPNSKRCMYAIFRN